MQTRVEWPVGCGGGEDCVTAAAAAKAVRNRHPRVTYLYYRLGSFSILRVHSIHTFSVGSLSFETIKDGVLGVPVILLIALLPCGFRCCLCSLYCRCKGVIQFNISSKCTQPFGAPLHLAGIGVRQMEDDTHFVNWLGVEECLQWWRVLCSRIVYGWRGADIMRCFEFLFNIIIFVWLLLP